MPRFCADKDKRLPLGDGDRSGTDADFAEAAANGVVVKQDMYIPRIHPAPIETCGCVADYNKATGKLTVSLLISQAPHVVRTLFHGRCWPA